LSADDTSSRQMEDADEFQLGFRRFL